MQHKSIDVLGFGIAAVDDVLELERYPESGEKMLIRNVRRHGGGQCTTALVAAARLGKRCAYAGMLGDNELSNYTRQVLEREHVAVVDGPRPHPEARPYHSTILVDCASGERTILFSKAGVHGPEPADISEHLIAQARVLLVDQLGPSGTLHACRIARSLGVPIVSDLEAMADGELREIMRITDHLVFSAHIVRRFTGQQDVSKAIHELNPESRICTAVTDGVRGCWFIMGETPQYVRHQPAFTVPVKDTTGCGDVFHGVYAACLAEGMGASEAVRWSAAASALKATAPGGQEGIPTRQAVESFLANRA